MGTGKIIQADNIDGIKVLKNFISNGLASINTLGWVTYADAAGALPVDGTGGSPSVTFTRTTTTPLSEAGSFLFSKGASNLQGNGASYNFSIDSNQKGRVLQISFDYLVSSGTFAAGSDSDYSDLTVWLYDVTNSRLVDVSVNKLFSNSTTLSDAFSATFQASIDSTSYRLIFHVSTVSTSAWVLKIDNVSVSPAVYSFGPIITEFKSYTPTITHDTGGMTNATTTTKYRRVGDSIEILGTILFSGASAAFSNVYVSLPSGLTTDLTKLISANNKLLGQVSVSVTGVNTFIGVSRYRTTTTFDLPWTYTNTSDAGSGTDPLIMGPISNTLPFTFGNTDTIEFSYSVPILEWANATAQYSDGYDGRIILFTGTKPSTQSLTANVTNITFTMGKDTTGSWSSDTYTVKSSGDYRFTMSIINDTAVAAYQPYINGVAYPSVCFTPAANIRGIGSIVIPNLVAGNTITFRSSATVTTAASVSNYISIEKLSGSASMTPTSTVVSKVTRTTTQSIPNATYTKITFPNVEIETGAGLWDSVNNRMVIQEPGIYEVFGSVRWGANATGFRLITIYKNGSAFEYSAPISGAGVNPDVAKNVINELMQLVASDYLEIYGHQSSGGNLNAGDSGVGTKFWVVKVK